MSISSDPQFCVHHALRIKGFANVSTLGELTAFDASVVESHLKAMEAGGLTMFREARGLWQLTPDGRAAHVPALEADSGRPGFRDGLGAVYSDFLTLNEDFKQVCTDWQLRNGEVNDHTDSTYDAAVLARLGDINERAQPLCAGMATTSERFAPYGSRLTESLAALSGGENKMFTGVMCGSYHDVWMELHEDLILTQGIDRAKEGSF